MRLRAACLILALLALLPLLLITTTEAQPLLLGITAVTDSTVRLTWTAPTDNVGVTAYAMRYAPNTADTTDFSTWWQAATSVFDMPIPQPPGLAEHKDVPVESGQTYIFNIVSGDAAGNWSGKSNWAVVDVPTEADTTPPARIDDLEVVVWPNPTSDGRFPRETEMEVRE